MPVPMVGVWVVRMVMDQFFVMMFVNVRLCSVPGEIMSVPVMDVMHVGVPMIDRVMDMFMHMALGQVQYDSRSH